MGKTFNEYLIEVGIRNLNERDWRLGQTYFNVLHEMRPDLSEVIRGRWDDPFYVDDRIPAFLEYMEGAWNA